MPIFPAPWLGFAGGLHAASCGAYKDSPHESVLMRRFLRELAFASVLALALAASSLARGEPAFAIYLSAFALTCSARRPAGSRPRR